MLKLLLLAAVAVECNLRTKQVWLEEFRILGQPKDGLFGPVFKVKRIANTLDNGRFYAMEAVETYAGRSHPLKNKNLERKWRRMLRHRQILVIIEQRLYGTEKASECRWIKRLQYASSEYTWIFYFYRYPVEGETLAQTISMEKHSLDISTGILILVDLLAIIRMMHKELRMALKDLCFDDFVVDEDGRLVLWSLTNIVDIDKKDGPERESLANKDWQNMYKKFSGLLVRDSSGENPIAFLHDLTELNFDAKTENDFFIQQGIVWKEVFDRTFTPSPLLIQKQRSSTSDIDITEQMLKQYNLGCKRFSILGMSYGLIDAMFKKFSYGSECPIKLPSEEPSSYQISSSSAPSKPATTQKHITNYDIVEELKHGHFGHAFAIRMQGQFYAMEAVDTFEGWRVFQMKRWQNMKRERDRLVLLEERIIEFMTRRSIKESDGFRGIRRLRLITIQDTWIFFHFDMVNGGTLHDRLTEDKEVLKKSLYDILLTVHMLHVWLNVAHGTLGLNKILVGDDGRIVLSGFEQMNDLHNLHPDEAKRLKMQDYKDICNPFSNLLRDESSEVNPIAFLDDLDDKNFKDKMSKQNFFSGIDPDENPFPSKTTSFEQVFFKNFKKYNLGGTHFLNRQFESKMRGILNEFPYVPKSASDTHTQTPLIAQSPP